MSKGNKLITTKTPTVKSAVKLVRGIKSSTRLHLYVKACGRCQFAGCNRDLMQHELTQTKGNFGEMAHVVAFEEDGPRGRQEERPIDINCIENLMLLCAPCHKLIDDNPADYPREKLEFFKQEHENRIKIVAELGPGMKSALLIFKSPIRGQDVSIDENHIRQAMLPYYPVSSKGSRIDLTNQKESQESSEFLEIAKSQIMRAVSSLFDLGGEMEKASHLSVFGIGPMVQLMFLGAALSNKVPTSFYQKHRDTDDWKWKTEGSLATYKLSKIKQGSVDAPVVLVLALSGTIPFANLPDPYTKDASIYEITLDGPAPHPMFLRQKADLDAFRSVYLETLGIIIKEHGLIETISVFPAVPAPIAIMCGRERLPKVHPKLRVYDFDHANGGFKFQAIVGD